MRLIPPPNIQEQLIPVIACLPTAFISPQPPPALLPYLSPILRQRLSLLSAKSQTNGSRGSSHHSSDSNWLHLLTWSPAHARRLNEIVSGLQLEPHPVSGELELFEEDIDGEQGRIKYRRLDSETLQAKCDIAQHEISVVWVWCTNDSGGVGLENAVNGEAKDGWRVAEVIPCGDEEGKREGEWSDTVEEAEEAASSRPDFVEPASVANEERVIHNGTELQNGDGDEDDDDDYWAAYDRTPANRTPAKHSPAPMTSAQNPHFSLGQNQSAEKDYFERYGSEVQPAMDAHDPDEEEAAQGETEYEDDFSGRQTRASQQGLQQQTHDADAQGLGMGLPTTYNVNDHAPAAPPVDGDSAKIESPIPSRPSSPKDQSPVERLEATAHSASVAEVGVKQHISTELKSLYRLARSAGIERVEFERVVQRELEVLDLMDY